MRLVPSVDRGIRVLEILGDNQPLSTFDLARRTRLPISTVYQLVATLSRYGFVGSNQRGQLFIGSRLRSHSDRFMAKADPGGQLSAAVRRLRDATNETAEASMLVGRNVVTVASAESPRDYRPTSFVGAARPAFLTAKGRVLTAQTPAAAGATGVDGIASLARSDGRHSGEPERVRSSRGFAMDNPDPDGVWTIAVVLDHFSETCLSVSAPASRITLEDGVAYRAALERVARELSSVGPHA